MSLRRRTVLAAAAAAVAVTAASPGFIAATSPPTDTAGEDVTISFLTHWPPETVELLEAAASAYSRGESQCHRGDPGGAVRRPVDDDPGTGGRRRSDDFRDLRPVAARAGARRARRAGARGGCHRRDGELAGRCGHRSHRRRRLVRRAQRDRPLRPQLQHRAVRGGRHRGAAGDVGRAGRRRRGAHRARRRHDHPAGLRADQLVGGRGRPPVRLAARLQRWRADRRGRDAGAEHAGGAGDVRAVREPRVRRAGHRPDDGHLRRQHAPARSSTTSSPATRR